jgi:hypothetical protein
MNARSNTGSAAKLDYEVLDPNQLHFGKSYSEWVCDWFNWFISVDADSRNSGPVVFLRSYGMPGTSIGARESDPTGQSSELNILPNMMGPQSMNYSGMHPNIPNIRIGDNRLQIYDDQYVLIPIINSYWVKYDPSVNEDWGSMEEYTSIAIGYGKEPPHKNQLEIDGRPVELKKDQDDHLKKDQDDLRRFRINTSIFTAVVPETEPGRSVKDYLGHPMPPGNYPAVVQGYFVMVKFTYSKAHSIRSIHSWGEAPPDVRGPYFAELLYQIEVRTRVIKSADPTERFAARPPASKSVLNRILAIQQASRELDKKESDRLRSIFETKGDEEAVNEQKE